MRAIIVHPNVPRARRDFKTGIERTTVPDQSYSLKEMFVRFVRREALPVGREGFYADGEHDLEKLRTLDPVELAEMLPIVRADVEAKKAAVEAAQKAYSDGERAKRKAELQEMLKEIADLEVKQKDPQAPPQ